MSDDIHLHGLFETESRTDVLESWLDIAKPVGTDNERVYSYYFWKESGSELITEKSEADEPDELVDTFSNFEGAYLKLTYGSIGFGLSINESIDEYPVSPQYTVSVSQSYFRGDVDHPEGQVSKYVENIIDLATKSNEVIDPLYTYGTAPSNLRYHPRHEDIKQRRLAARLIHWLNIIPPELVEIIGRTNLISSPAWRTKELDDGSVLLVVNKSPVGEGEYSVDAVVECLGLNE